MLNHRPKRAAQAAPDMFAIDQSRSQAEEVEE
jgi:hypothetical protein